MRRTCTDLTPLQVNNEEILMSEAGEIAPGDEAPPGTPGSGENICPVCGGSGRVDGQPCSNCQGTGRVTEGIGGG
jgi:DnaJ-class molecular chaperone